MRKEPATEGPQPFPLETIPLAIPKKAADALKGLIGPETFSLLDILSLPLVEAQTETKVFHARGRDWPITVKTEALNDPEEFFALSALMSEGRKVKAVEIKVDATQPFTLKRGQYIGALTLLAKVVVSPSFGFDEWAEFGRRVGGSTIASIINFALKVNGFTDESIAAEEAEAGE